VHHQIRKLNRKGKKTAKACANHHSPLLSFGSVLHCTTPSSNRYSCTPLPTTTIRKNKQVNPISRKTQEQSDENDEIRNYTDSWVGALRG